MLRTWLLFNFFWANTAILESVSCDDGVTSLLQVQSDRVPSRSQAVNLDQLYSQSLAWQQAQGLRSPFAGSYAPAWPMQAVPQGLQQIAEQRSASGELPSISPAQVNPLAQAQAQAQDALKLARMESSQALKDLDFAAAKVESARSLALREAAADLGVEEELQKTRLALLQATSAKDQNKQLALLQATAAPAEQCGGADQLPCTDFYKVLTFDYKYTVAVGIARWAVVLAGGLAGMAVLYYVLRFVFSVTGWIMCVCQTICCLAFLGVIAGIAIAAKNSQSLVTSL